MAGPDPIPPLPLSRPSVSPDGLDRPGAPVPRPLPTPLPAPADGLVIESDSRAETVKFPFAGAAAAPRRGLLSGLPDPVGRVLEYGELAEAVYGDENPPGWRREALVPGGSPVVEETSGLRAVLYRPQDATDSRAVLAFAGTDPSSVADIVTNVDQFSGGLPRQYRQAMGLARLARSRYGDDLVLTGHSLGGALAQLGGLTTGARAYSFNGAGLNSALRLRAWLRDDLQHASRITNINVRGEILSSPPLLDVPGLGAEQVGRVIELEPPEEYPAFWRVAGRMEARIAAHGMSVVNEALRRAAAE